MSDLHLLRSNVIFSEIKEFTLVLDDANLQ